MPHADLDLESWTALSDQAAERVAKAVGREADAEFIELRSRHYAERTTRLAMFQRRGQVLSLVPGGDVRLGYDGDRFRSTPAQAASYLADAELYALPDLHTFIDLNTTPPRSVAVPALLVATEAVVMEKLTYNAVVDALAEHGERLLTPDEWEYACGAGATTLWRWGDDCPEAYQEYSDVEPQAMWAEPNSFELVFGQDECTAEFGVMCGGDGGVLGHAGAGSFLLHLPHASAFRASDWFEWGHSPDQVLYDLAMRPAVPLQP